MENSVNQIIHQTKNWIKETVIGLNFCPFASKSFTENSILYKVLFNAQLKSTLEELIIVCNELKVQKNIETALLIFPDKYSDFMDYLDMIHLAEKLIIKEKLTGIFQIATFHPHYRFAETEIEDPSNYTNRSPYPMLHILREESIEKALEKYPNPEEIPNRNIAKAHQLGADYLKMLLNSSFKVE